MWSGGKKEKSEQLASPSHQLSLESLLWILVSFVFLILFKILSSLYSLTINKPINTIKGLYTMPVAGGYKGKWVAEPTLEINLVWSYLVFGSHELLILNSIIWTGNNRMTTLSTKYFKYIKLLSLQILIQMFICYPFVCSYFFFL